MNRFETLNSVEETLGLVAEAVREARTLVRSEDLNIERQMAHALNGIALVLDDLGMTDTSRRIADEGAALERLTPNASGGEVDDAAAEELVLYITNDARFWGPGSQGDALEKRYAKLWKRGQFNEERAMDGYMHVLKRAAQQYAKEHGDPGQRWYEMFNVPTRRAAAQDLTQYFVDEAKLGNFRG